MTTSFQEQYVAQLCRFENTIMGEREFQVLLSAANPVSPNRIHTCTCVSVTWQHEVVTRTSLQWSLNNPSTNGPAVLGCNKEVTVLQMTSIKPSHPFLAQMTTTEYDAEHV